MDSYGKCPCHFNSFHAWFLASMIQTYMGSLLLFAYAVSQHFLEGTSKFWRGNVWLSGWEAFIQYIWSIYRWKERIFWCDFMRFKNSACEQWQWMILNSTSNKTTAHHQAFFTSRHQVTQLMLIESVKKTRSWNGLQWPAFLIAERLI